MSDDLGFARTLHALWWVAVDLSSTRPLLITVDDAQWADLPSRRFPTYLARRVADLPVAMVVGTRPPQDTGGPLSELTSGRLAEILAPQPLSSSALGGSAGLRGREPTPSVIAALRTATGGNPLLAGQLLDELAHRGLDLGSDSTAGVLAGARAEHRVSVAAGGPVACRRRPWPARWPCWGAGAIWCSPARWSTWTRTRRMRRSTSSWPDTSSTAVATTWPSSTPSSARRCSPHASGRTIEPARASRPGPAGAWRRPRARGRPLVRSPVDSVPAGWTRCAPRPPPCCPRATHEPRSGISDAPWRRHPTTWTCEPSSALPSSAPASPDRLAPTSWRRPPRLLGAPEVRADPAQSSRPGDILGCAARTRQRLSSSACSTSHSSTTARRA